MKNYILIHKDTNVTCCNCGFEYSIKDTKELSEEEPYKRICIDCTEDDNDN
jgi:hypothetical protein